MWREAGSLAKERPAPQPGPLAAGASIPRIAVLVPCFNEERAIGKVVADFRAALPDAAVIVYDNNSSDRTAEVARAAGAVVRHERRQGKAAVVRRMFADIDADVYVLVDGDDTYDAAAAPRLVERLLEGPYDMVNAIRVTRIKEAYRPGHRFGNALLTGLVGRIFGRGTEDMLSGYRAFSRRFVKTFPVLSSGFEIETELTVHALELDMAISEVETAYKDRPPGSASKLSTFRDGFRIMFRILLLVESERPLQFFALIAAALAGLSLALGIPVVLEYIATGLVPRLPTAVLASALMLLSFLALTCGLVLDTVTRGRREMKKLKYLELGPPGAGA